MDSWEKGYVISNIEGDSLLFRSKEMFRSISTQSDMRQRSPRSRLGVTVRTFNREKGGQNVENCPWKLTVFVGFQCVGGKTVIKTLGVFF